MGTPLNFHPATQKWFDNHFSKASPPQEKGWPSIARNKHTLICAPTGSGKTLAAFLWSIDDLVRSKLDGKNEKNSSVHTLYISPLKALNNDIERNLQFPLRGISDELIKTKMGNPSISTLVRTGDTPANIRAKMLTSPPDILITTPESLYLLLTNPKGRRLFANLKYIIVDEIHAICANKRGVHLSLSLERLMPLCADDPVRIGLSATQKPLKRVADYLGGVSRHVNIIDTGQKKNFDLKVISPVANYSELPESSVWPEVYRLLYDLIKKHKSTLIFAQMRSQTEKIARVLNTFYQADINNENAVLALAHHGSLAKETRFEIETRLKNGTIPAVIATGSLELGIDIGSIDLVVQLESPKSVSGALQRVGRSGHLLDASSKGRIIPLYRADLDDCAALTGAMLQGDIEETKIPENALDVLAQHIVAEVAMQDWDFNNLYNLFTKSYCYKNLSVAAFSRVVEMLSGKIGNASLSALNPRLNWDTVNNRLISLRGSQLSAVLNGGTIPDRAYFGVYLNDENVRLGEMEEEFVFESRVGHVFFLGNNEYRITDIRQDRIIVALHKEQEPRAPFWKGDLLYRDYNTNRNIGAFRAELQNHYDKPDAKKWLQKTYHTDEYIAENLIDIFTRQMNHTNGIIATDKIVLLEHFIDIDGEPLLLIQAPFGARVTGLWAIIIAGLLENQNNIQVQYSYDDDAFLVRLLDTPDFPEFDSIMNVDFQNIKKILWAKLIESPMFSVYFRYNAARALMLPRSQPHRRIPLWLQRLRAADLLQVVREIPDFPIIAETYRELLYDVFDWPALQDVFTKIQNGTITIKKFYGTKPSPQSSGLLFKMISSNMYEYDRSRKSAEGAINFTELLSDIIRNENIPQIISSDTNKQMTARLQYVYPGFQARDKEELSILIEKLGPIPEQEIAHRSKPDAFATLQELDKEKRILFIEKPFLGWISASNKKDYEFPWEKEGVQNHLIRIFRNNGTLTFSEICNLCPAEEQIINSILVQLVKEEILINGKLIKDDDEIYWCNRFNFTQMYRRSIGERRKYVQPADRNILNKFLFSWHFISTSPLSFDEVFQKYYGTVLPPRFFANQLLNARFTDQPEKILRENIQNGKLVHRVFFDRNSNNIMETFIPRASGHYFWKEENTHEKPSDEKTAGVIQFLKENGASYFDDICEACELQAKEVRIILLELLKKELISSDNYEALDSSVLQKKESSYEDKSPLQRQISQRFRRPSRNAIKSAVTTNERFRAGRWFLLNTFSVMGKKRTRAEMAEYQARVLLNRYGIVVKEWYRHEQNLLPWIEIFNALKKLEWQGEIRRSYFVSGLSGLQFALPEAINSLEKIQIENESENTYSALVSTIDPALPFGGSVGWQIYDIKGEEIKIIRLQSNFIFIKNDLIAAFMENKSARIITSQNWKDSFLIDLIAQLKRAFKISLFGDLRKLEIQMIDYQPAAENPHAKIFIENGFERDGTALILWPSAL